MARKASLRAGEVAQHMSAYDSDREAEFSVLTGKLTTPSISHYKCLMTSTLCFLT